MVLSSLLSTYKDFTDIIKVTPLSLLQGQAISVTLQACPEALLSGLSAGEYLPQTYSQNLVFTALSWCLLEGVRETEDDSLGSLISLSKCWLPVLQSQLLAISELDNIVT